MLDYSEIFSKAIRRIEERGQNARLQVQRREEEIAAKIPAVAALRRELAQTSIQLSRIILEGRGNVKEQLEELKQRNLYVQSRIEELLEEQGYPKDYLALHHTCPLCKDTGFVGNQKCSCLKNLLRELSVQELNACSPLSLCSFSSFELGYYPVKADQNGQSPREVMGRIYEYCQNYARDFSQNSPSLFFLGDTGLGKTHLSLAIANAVLEKGHTVLYGSAQDFLRLVEQEHFGRTDRPADTLGMLLDADLLILDDLGVEFQSEFYVATVYNIINTRLNREKPTIINTNLSVEEIERKYSQRIVSRLFSGYVCLRFVGSDIRLLKKKAAVDRRK